MSGECGVNLWSTEAHALDYLRKAEGIPHRLEGEAALLELLPPGDPRILDLGTGAGRLITIVKGVRPKAKFVAVDFSPTMLQAIGAAFGGDPHVQVLRHDFDEKLPPMGRFDAVISSFAIHHVVDRRKRALYQEIFGILEPGGVFCNLEHVASPTPRLHQKFLEAMGCSDEDPSNKLLDLEIQLRWLREIGFEDVDCYWKWRELALLAGWKPR
jgi:tRNA (cmo5U34)-methyltransferase